MEIKDFNFLRKGYGFFFKQNQRLSKQIMEIKEFFLKS